MVSKPIWPKIYERWLLNTRTTSRFWVVPVLISIGSLWAYFFSHALPWLVRHKSNIYLGPKTHCAKFMARQMQSAGTSLNFAYSEISMGKILLRYVLPCGCLKVETIWEWNLYCIKLVLFITFIVWNFYFCVIKY